MILHPRKSAFLTAALLTAGVLSGLAASSAHAQPVVFTGFDTGASSGDPRPVSNAAAAQFDLAAAALSPLTRISFESAPVGTFSSLTVAPGVTLTGADYNGNNQSINNAPTGTPSALYGYNTTSGGANFLYVNGGFVTFTFAQPMQSFGAYFTGIQFAGETVNFNDGTSRTLAIPNPGAGVGGSTFFGFVDSGASIASIVIDTRNPTNLLGDFIGVDDVRSGATVTAAAVPEPSEYAAAGMFGATLLFGMVKARRKKVAATA